MGSFARKRLGDVLVEAGVITEQQLQETMTEQVSTHKRIGQLLIEKRLISEEKLVEILEEQLGIGQVNLYSYNINPEVATSIPLYLAKRHLVIPIDKQDGMLKLAMADPMNIIAIDDVEMLTGLTVEPVLASESSINQTIDQLFSLAETVAEDSTSAAAHSEEEIAQLRALVEEAPIVKVVNALIHQAVTEGASDIHIEPLDKGVRVRMRIDGILHDLMTPPKDTQPLIVSRIKIMANLDIAERRMPQDGRITIQVGLKDVNMRVSTMPTIHGEKVVIRILDRDRVILPLDRLGFSENNHKTFLNFLLSHTGMILVTGPTGSGKTTTLYSALNYLNRAEENIITVEDPVEYRLEGINQVQVNPRINLTFANALRSILRQDPNVIMIGEIRDLETAEMATRAALTGHLVLSTLHTSDACSTISRLLDMGVDSYLITSSLIGVVAQRLVRRICENCREEYSLSPQEQVLFQTAFRRQAPETLQRGHGCRQCNETGYRGRFAIHEMLAMTREQIRLVLQRASAEELHEKAVEQGMVPLMQEGLRRIMNGETTIEEVVRVAYSGSGAEELVAAAAPAAPAKIDLFGEALDTVSARETAEAVVAEPALELESSGPEMVRTGDTVVLKVALLNSGTAALRGITLTAPNFDPHWRHQLEQLAPGERVQFTAALMVPPGEGESLEALLLATAYFESREIMAQSSLTFTLARPALTIEKSGPPRAELGETVDCQYIVINTGNVPLSDVQVTDPFLGEGWGYTIGDLPPGGMSTFSMESFIGEGLSGTVTSEATVTGRYGDSAVSASDCLDMEIIDVTKPEIKMYLSGPTAARVGDMVTFRFEIVNSGTVALSGVKVTAPLFGRFWCNTIGTLDIGRSVKFSFSYTIPDGASQALENIARVTGTAGVEEVHAEAVHRVELTPAGYQEDRY
ncbi:MAG TPA: Flp pilus assembly complex ATPase component TadA [Firmicutes bacterium]|nr:Flp pilus assembly complex ATPase component TadA [Bacillota bacterium]